MTSQPEVMTAAEIAALLRCSDTHVAALCRAKRIPAVNLGGGLGWRAHREDVEAFIRGRAVVARPRAARAAK